MVGLLSLVLGLIVASLVFAISLKFEEKMQMAATKAVIAGVLSAIVSNFSRKVPAIIAVTLFLAIGLTMMLYLVFWWIQNGSDMRELIYFIVLDCLLSLVVRGAAIRIIDIINVRALVGLVRALSSTILMLSIGFFIANKIWFSENLNRSFMDDKEETEERGDAV